MVSTTSHLLHALELPDPDVCRDAAMYVRLAPTGAALVVEGVRLESGSAASFDTYFNCCTISAWNRSAPLDDLRVDVDVDAPCTIEIWNTSATGSRVVADACVTAGAATLTVPDHEQLDGICWIRVRAGEHPVMIRRGEWHTSTKPRREVHLGVVMTTFNRQAYVRRNLENLDRYSRRSSESLRDVRITIVNNGSSLEVDTDCVAFPLEVIGNRNLGGAGGFARGLIEYRRGGWATHVVFADDDILLPPALIDRTAAFLRFAERAEQCLSSSMLDESDPTRQYECGAGYRVRRRHPAQILRGNLDLTDPAALVANSRHLPIDYAAWWFFAFPLTLTDDNPLPVFVRGDDVEFGLSHTRGKVEVMNGIGVWHQNFDYKNTPLTFHLEARNHPLVCTLADDGYSRHHLIGRFGPAALRFLLALKYSSAEHVLAGVREFLDGPERWLRMDHEVEFARINTGTEERPHPLPLDHLATPPTSDSTSPHGLWVLLTLGGHLVPARWSRRHPVSEAIQTRQLAAALWREEIVYIDQPSGHGFIARRDRRRFFRGLVDLGRTMLLVWQRFPVAARGYRAHRGEMVSTNYWQSQFDTPAGKPGPTRSDS